MPFESAEGATAMATCILMLLLILVIDIVALRWGADSRDGPNSPEWQRRSSWFLPIDHTSPSGYGAGEAYLYLYRYPAAREPSS
jgi:hypothetical protein